MKKCNLGCGKNQLDGYINIDIREDVEPDKVMDVSDLTSIAPVDEIFAKDILEHFGRLKWRDVLANWVSCLNDGGVIKLRFPDFFELYRYYKEDRINYDKFEQLLLGVQNYPENTHKAILTMNRVVEELEKLGMEIVWKEMQVYGQARITASYGKMNLKLQVEHLL